MSMIAFGIALFRWYVIMTVKRWCGNVSNERQGYPEAQCVCLNFRRTVYPCGKLLPVLLPAAEYHELIDQEIIIESVERITLKSTTVDRITTKSGERFNISGDYSGVDIHAALPRGKTVSIKYYENELLFTTKKYAEVIEVDNVCVVRYDNDQDNGGWVLYLLSVCSFLIGAAAAGFVIWQIKDNRKKQAKRDQKIIKKYGAVKKKQ